MKKRRFGNTGLEVCPVGLGGFPFGGRQLSAGWNPWTPEGRRTAIATVHRAIERGINYMDTAPSYGDGNSESIFGEALEDRRDQVILATKCPWQGATADAIIASVHASLKRLKTDHADVIQLHGGMFEPADVDHIVNGGPLDALLRMKKEGKTRFIGFTTEEPWTARPLISLGVFDMVQLRYNLGFQSAALHALDDAKKAGLGVAIMRPLTSGIFPRLVGALAPEWQKAKDVWAVALSFVLSDSRVHVANVGMRWPGEVDKNVDLAESLNPGADIADLPRWTIDVYRTADREAGL